MMDQNWVLFVMVGMGAVTYIPRLLPVWLFSSRQIPKLVSDWLRYVPMAVLAALLLPSLVLADGQLNLSADNLFLWAAIPTFLVAVKTRSLFATVIAGMSVVAGARLLFGL